MNRKLRRILLGIPLAALMLLLSSCAVFQIRHRQWEARIHRGGDGVADFARDYTLEGVSPALLLVHGFGDSPDVWSRLAPELSLQGYTVRVHRLPGWGEPPAVKASLRLEDWLGSLERETLRLRNEHGRVVVLAHSMGGCLSALLAVEDRLAADALILYAPMMAVSDARSPLLTARGWHRVGSALLPGSMLVESLFSDHARVQAPRGRERRDPFVPVGMYALLFEAMDRLQNAGEGIPFPLCLVLPGEDRVVRSGVSEAWFGSMPSPENLLRREEAAGHVLPLDLDPRREAGLVSAWISSLFPDTPSLPETP